MRHVQCPPSVLLTEEKVLKTKAVSAAQENAILSVAVQFISKRRRQFSAKAIFKAAEHYGSKGRLSEMIDMQMVGTTRFCLLRIELLYPG